jgi:hypothetical protein
MKKPTTKMAGLVSLTEAEVVDACCEYLANRGLTPMDIVYVGVRGDRRRNGPRVSFHAVIPRKQKTVRSEKGERS